jgi:eukaryotic-like serine/threonine-protein kinase
MALQKGTRLGAYEILSPLGAGGMGEVYRARDTKLQRDVALKILPEAMARDAQRMARFEREAQVLASLNHSNIAAIYGLEESDGIHVLVMELVEGETLGEKIVGEGSALPRERGALPYDDALLIAKQITEALEYAHERGVIHRDLKPANVKITPEGTVKVLDFGLAKVLDTQDSTPAMDMADSPTLSAMATQAGMILGTAAYMSPEQARGQRVDRRVDIWAFGCVLYEMLTGRKPFEGEMISDVLAAVLRAEPEWTAIPETTPLSIQRLIQRCLVKDPKQRLRDIGDARIAIEETLSGSPLLTIPLPQGEVGPEERDRVRVSALRRALPWAVAATLAAVAVVALVGWWRGTRSVAPMLAWSGEILPGPTIAFFPRVSPNGNLIAFQAMVDNQTQVAVMDPASGNWTVLTHDRTSGWVSSLSWSPDGSRIYFDRKISGPLGVYSVPSLGGEARRVLANAVSPEPLPDGSLLLSRLDPDREFQIYHYWPDTGRLQALGAWTPSSSQISLMRVFPGGKEAVFFGTVKGNSSENSPRLYLLDIATGSTRLLARDLPTPGVPSLAVTPDGQSVLVDLPDGNLQRIVAVPRSGTGPVRTLVRLTAIPLVWDVAPDGSLYVDQVNRPLEIVRLPESGGTPEVLASSEMYMNLYRIAPVEFPDGRFLLPTMNAGRHRLLLGNPGGSFVPLIETNEETAPPVVQLGNDELALMVGSPPARTLSIASLKEGRIIRRFKATEGKEIWTLASSPDGKDLYYVTSGSVWSVPSQGGSPRKICAGDSVVADPNGHDLIVSLQEQEYTRLERVPLSGGPAQAIQVKSQLAINSPLGPNALNKEGKLLVNVEGTSSYFYRLAILDLATGKLTQVPLNYTGDIVVPAWASNGGILATASPFRAHIWRFRPVMSYSK